MNHSQLLGSCLRACTISALHLGNVCRSIFNNNQKNGETHRLHRVILTDHSLQQVNVLNMIMLGVDGMFTFYFEQLLSLLIEDRLCNRLLIILSRNGKATTVKRNICRKSPNRNFPKKQTTTVRQHVPPDFDKNKNQSVARPFKKL